MIRFDPPGVGGSPLPAAPYRLPGLARIVLRLLDVLGQKEVDVLGISWGGGLAQQLARTGRRRCRRLVLVATGTGSLMVPAHPRVLAQMATPRRYLDPDHMRRIAAEIYGGSARTDPRLATWLLHTHSRVGPRRGYVLPAAGERGLDEHPVPAHPAPADAGTHRRRRPAHPADQRAAARRPDPERAAARLPRRAPRARRGPGLLVPVIEEFLHDDASGRERPRSRGGEHHMTEDLTAGIGDALSTDYFFLRDQLTDDQLGYLTRAREFVDDVVLPTINDYWERAQFPWPIIEKLGAAGLVGDGLQGYGCPPMDPLSAGLVTMELARGDGSISTFVGVQAGLAMRSIAYCGSEDQKQRWLPRMARLDKIGAFALTEPDHGSDSVSLETTARRDGDSWVLNGRKKWIGNGSIADVVVVWARDTADGRVKGFLVEKGTPGYTARVIERKASLRAVWQAEIALDDVRVEEANRLPGANSFTDTGRVLAATRISCAWMALGHAVAGFDAALTYAGRRRQFGRTLAHFQIVQQRLVHMLADVTAMQLYCLQIARLAESGTAHRHPRGPGQAAQHRQGPRGPRRGPRPARRQRHPARLPRHAAHGRHRVRAHLRGHRDHADPHRRPRHHRRRRLHLILPSGGDRSDRARAGSPTRSREGAYAAVPRRGMSAQIG